MFLSILMKKIKGFCMQELRSSGQRIRFARNMLGLTRKEIKDQFKISVNTLQTWEANKILLTEKGARKLNEVFIKLGLLCSEKWLLTGQGQIPILLQNLPPINDDFSILTEIEIFKTLNPNSIVLIVTDNGMEPIFSIGDFVGGVKKENVELEPLIGENCIIETTGDDIFFRKLLRGSKKTFFNLACVSLSTNQQPIIPDVKVRSAARIILHRKR